MRFCRGYVTQVVHKKPNFEVMRPVRHESFLWFFVIFPAFFFSFHIPFLSHHHVNVIFCTVFRRHRYATQPSIEKVTAATTAVADQTNRRPVFLWVPGHPESLERKAKLDPKSVARCRRRGRTTSFSKQLCIIRRWPSRRWRGRLLPILALRCLAAAATFAAVYCGR